MSTLISPRHYTLLCSWMFEPATNIIMHVVGDISRKSELLENLEEMFSLSIACTSSSMMSIAIPTRMQRVNSLEEFWWFVHVSEETFLQDFQEILKRMLQNHTIMCYPSRKSHIRLFMFLCLSIFIFILIICRLVYTVRLQSVRHQKSKQNPFMQTRRSR